MPDHELESIPIQADWYYVGHYGQLGPLTLEQMADLARDGVVDRETFVWKGGMSDWVKASSVRELIPHLGQMDLTPPTFGVAPMQGLQPPPSPGTAPTAPHQMGISLGQSYSQQTISPAPFGAMTSTTYGFYINQVAVPKSDKSRVAAAILGLIFPGAGRFYLGYAAHGAWQLILCFCGIGMVWSW
ncbi:MAG: GYF domain-containing protein, partial [Armatimonadota bacterium]